jgi:hypothetical protein
MLSMRLSALNGVIAPATNALIFPNMLESALADLE